jgi:phage terminase large subunit-like protein
MSTHQSLPAKHKKALSLRTVSRTDFSYLPTIELDVPGPNDTFETRVYPDYPSIARIYCEMVLSEEIPACLYIKQAAERYLAMRAEAAKPDAAFFFSDAWACDFLEFMEKLNLPSGNAAGDKFIMQPWQILIGCALFGFRRNDPQQPNEIGARLVREVYIEVPRGSGKSPLSAGIALYCWLCENENGSQVFIGAATEEQARHVYTPMAQMIKGTPGLVEQFDIHVTKNTIRRSRSEMEMVRLLSSIAHHADGANPHVVVMEELHAQNEDMFSVMKSSLAKRVNNLFISISTAGRRSQGVGWNTRKRLIDVLAGRSRQDSFFGLIYTLDKEEIEDKRLAHDPECWIKANPMWGITLSKSALLESLEEARADSPARMLEFERTRLNIWSNSAGGMINPDHWEKCLAKPEELEGLKGRTAWIGGDLGSKNDISSIAIIIDDKDNYQKTTVFSKHFIPEGCPALLTEEFGPLYQSWVDANHLVMTRGPVTDYDLVEAEIRAWLAEYDVQAIVFDNYQSNSMVAALHGDGYPAMQMQPGVKTVSDPTKDLLAKIQGGLLRHDGNAVMTWMAANVVGYFDQRGNVLAKKETPNSPYKIDGFSALIAANVAREDKLLDIKRRRKSIYEIRGLRGAGPDPDSKPDPEPA